MLIHEVVEIDDFNGINHVFVVVEEASFLSLSRIYINNLHSTLIIQKPSCYSNVPLWYLN